MRNVSLPGRVLPALALLLAAAFGSQASPPPPEQDRPAADPRPTIKVPLKHRRDLRWHLDRNFASGIRAKAKDGQHTFRVVRAADVRQLDPAQRRDAADRPADEPKRKSPFALWQKQVPDPAAAATGGSASVVDQNVFTDLRMVNGRDAERLGAEGVVIGRVKRKDYDPVELVHFLVASGIVDANLHIRATVTGSYSSSEHGDWFSLHSDDPYWTNRANHARYSFGVHVAPDGTIRLINARDVGHLPVKRDEPPDGPRP